MVCDDLVIANDLRQLVWLKVQDFEFRAKPWHEMSYYKAPSIYPQRFN